MSVNPIDAKSLKNGEYYWLYAPGLDDDGPFVIGQYTTVTTGSSIPREPKWWADGQFYFASVEITPISHIKKPTWKPK